MVTTLNRGYGDTTEVVTSTTPILMTNVVAKGASV